MDFHERIRHARTERKLTQTDVGYLVKQPQSAISDYECGRAKPGPETLRRYVLAGLLTAEEALGLDGAA